VQSGDHRANGFSTKEHELFLGMHKLMGLVLGESSLEGGCVSREEMGTDLLLGLKNISAPFSSRQSAKTCSGNCDVDFALESGSSCSTSKVKKEIRYFVSYCFQLFAKRRMGIN
jgi:hypothetical protein